MSSCPVRTDAASSYHDHKAQRAGPSDSPAPPVRTHAEPLNVTTAPLTKQDQLSVSVNALPLPEDSRRERRHDGAVPDALKERFPPMVVEPR
jgi:hypothetical protein